MSEKKLGNYQNALDAAHEAHKLEPENLQNIVNLADVSRLMGNFDRALTYVTKAQAIDSENKNVVKLTKLLEKATSAS
jgi:tetratricopeptide (TPR) repeat protein